MGRNEAEQIIAILYGTDTETGRQLLRDLLEDMGLAVLTDEAVFRLAGKHGHPVATDRWILPRCYGIVCENSNRREAFNRP